MGSGELSGSLVCVDEVPLKRRTGSPAAGGRMSRSSSRIQPLTRQRSVSRINLTRSNSRTTVFVPKLTRGERFARGTKVRALWTSAFVVFLVLSVARHAFMGAILSQEVPSSSQPSGRIVALPDLHGDYEGAMLCLEMGGIIDRKTGHWIAGTDTVVQLGDIVDRGPDTVKLSHALIRLQHEARQAGGELQLLLGNHELLYMRGDYSYANEEEIKGLGGGNATRGMYRYKQMFGPTGVLGSEFQHRPVALQAGVDGCRSLFVHAGLQPQFLHNASDLAQLNERAAHDMLLESLYHSKASTAEIFRRDGPLRFRGFSQKSKKEICPPLSAMLKRLGVQRMIVGHTVQHHGPRTRCDGKLVLMDVGVSRAMTGRQLVWECDGGEINFLLREHADQVEGNNDE